MTRPSRIQSKRRGVLMLLVLLILALFVLLVISYILLASETAQIAASNSLAQDSSTPSTNEAQDDLDEIARQVLRGSNQPYSALSIHSLLEDMWGHNDTRQFSGTEVAPDDDASGVPYAFQPNTRGWLTAADPTQLDGTYETQLGGKLDEDYDAPDFRNLAMAFTDESGGVIPSLHRPALVRYLQTHHNARWTDTDNELKRRVLLRPLTEDHPDFDGSNAAFDPVDGPWDIDNDGDGQRDSIWIDAGVPVRTGPDGKLIKPLFAVLCMDLDSRLNVNTHSNLGLTTGTGLGHGPAEISLAAVATDHATLVSTRYGSDTVPGGAADPLAMMKQWIYPAGLWTNHVGQCLGQPFRLLWHRHDRLDRARLPRLREHERRGRQSLSAECP